MANEYEKNVLAEYHNHHSGKSVFLDAEDSKTNVAIGKFDEIQKEDSIEYLYEWIKTESRDIQVDFFSFEILLFHRLLEKHLHKEKNTKVLSPRQKRNKRQIPTVCIISLLGKRALEACSPTNPRIISSLKLKINFPV